MSAPSDTPLGVWGEFPNTVLHFTCESTLKVDLREPVTPAHREQFTALGLEQMFAVVTAQDPQGRTRTPRENRLLAMNLQRELRAAGTPFVPLEACSPDHTHCEASVAISLPQDEAIALARRHEQLAIFWFDGSRFWIVPAAASAPATPLPVRIIPEDFAT
jgi:hypothetical protein